MREQRLQRKRHIILLMDLALDRLRLFLRGIHGFLYILGRPSDVRNHSRRSGLNRASQGARFPRTSCSSSLFRVRQERERRCQFSVVWRFRLTSAPQKDTPHPRTLHIFAPYSSPLLLTSTRYKCNGQPFPNHHFSTRGNKFLLENFGLACPICSFAHIG